MTNVVVQQHISYSGQMITKHNVGGSSQGARHWHNQSRSICTIGPVIVPDRLYQLNPRATILPFRCISENVTATGH